MVYNAEYNFLFVHIQKTAGTSITKALLEIPSSQFIAPAHLRLRDITFLKERPFIFAVVRNPWDRLISWYEMIIRKGEHNDFSRYVLSSNNQSPNQISFSEFIRRIDVIDERQISELGQQLIGSENEDFKIAQHYLKSISFNQADYLTDAKDDYIFDKILRFESLDKDWSDLVAQLKLPIRPILTFENINPNAIDYSKYYSSPIDIKWVEELYFKDNQLFSYAPSITRCF